MDKTDNLIYKERVSSNRTEALFLVLTVFFLSLLVWRLTTRSLDIISAAFLFFFCMFLFYLVNYRILIIQLTPEFLKLRFGIFTWKVPLENVGECRLDKMPMVKRFGGAGIHFMYVRRRYRASFNFLEHPRVVVALKRKAGPVQDISFSTRRPDEVIRLLQYTVSSQRAAQQSA